MGYSAAELRRLAMSVAKGGGPCTILSLNRASRER